MNEEKQHSLIIFLEEAHESVSAIFLSSFPSLFSFLPSYLYFLPFSYSLILIIKFVIDPTLVFNHLLQSWAIPSFQAIYMPHEVLLWLHAES